jgi:hypothetical protein
MTGASSGPSSVHRLDHLALSDSPVDRSWVSVTVTKETFGCGPKLASRNQEAAGARFKTIFV